MSFIENKLTQADIDYLVEFVENSEHNDWEKAKHDLRSNMHRDSIRKSWYVGKYSGYSVYKFMQEKLEKGFSSDEEYIRLEALRDKVSVYKMQIVKKEPYFENIQELKLYKNILKRNWMNECHTLLSYVIMKSKKVTKQAY